MITWRGALSAHDALLMDLVYAINSNKSPQGSMIAAPEVEVDRGLKDRTNRRFDVVSLAFRTRTAFVFEVKVSYSDAMSWINGKRWERAVELGGVPYLATPEDLGERLRRRLPDCVGEIVKLNSGRWSNLPEYESANPPVPSAELLIGLTRSIGNTLVWWDKVEQIGRSLSGSLIEEIGPELPADVSDEAEEVA